ncbi:MAG: hypothetical protein CVV23_13670 [Ignavibacteriae bacterium HGW-Ignavibacteriae-2]|jgi:hypothetical protein|nr:MAG: hypothetical protein CVV23_13670 [Ignavibacteriae bacterium HGW-Ignavibacteriae-2]
MENEVFECEVCGGEVLAEDNFCVNCGAIFTEGINCLNHPSDSAEGVCVICQQAFCKNCGDMVNSLFLCYQHEHYEIIENYARLTGGQDQNEINFLNDCLLKEGLHSIVYSRKAYPLNVVGLDRWGPGDFKGRIINEFKLMVPLNEVITAQNILKNFEEKAPF